MNNQNLKIESKPEAQATPSTSPNLHNSSLSFLANWKFIAIVVVLGLVVGLGAILLLSRFSPTPTDYTPPIVQQTPPSQPSPSSQALDTSNWQTYRNEEFGFEVG